MEMRKKYKDREMKNHKFSRGKYDLEMKTYKRFEWKQKSKGEVIGSKISQNPIENGNYILFSTFPCQSHLKCKGIYLKFIKALKKSINSCWCSSSLWTLLRRFRRNMKMILKIRFKSRKMRNHVVALLRSTKHGIFQQINMKCFLKQHKHHFLIFWLSFVRISRDWKKPFHSCCQFTFLSPPCRPFVCSSSIAVDFYTSFLF